MTPPLSSYSNIFRRLAVTDGLKIGIGSESGIIFPDVRIVSDYPDHASAIRGWFAEKAEPLTSVIIQVALRDRPEATPAPSAEDVLPDVSLVPIILDAIASTVSAAALKWRSAPIRFLVFFLVCEWIFRGRVHLRLHSSLESVLSSFLSAVSAASSSGGRWPNYIDYTSSRASFLPLSWRTPAPVATAATAAAAAPPALVAPHGRRESVDRAPPMLPWAVRHPDAPRTADCPHCGPGVPHMLFVCKAYSAYKKERKHGPILPSSKFFLVGKSYNEARAARAAAMSAVALDQSN
jgi:hypothetical protein